MYVCILYVYIYYIYICSEREGVILASGASRSNLGYLIHSLACTLYSPSDLFRVFFVLSSGAYSRRLLRSVGVRFKIHFEYFREVASCHSASVRSMGRRISCLVLSHIFSHFPEHLLCSYKVPRLMLNPPLDITLS